MTKNRELTPSHIIALDGWRATAVIGVLVAHFISSSVINLGRFGVELFFVLSGRLMAEILFTKQTPLSIFFPRRFSRIYPAALLFIVITTFASRLFEGYEVPTWAMISGLTFTYNYATLFFGRTPFIDHMWSLCIEEHIYILLAIIAVSVRRQPISGIFIISILTILSLVSGAIQTWAFGLDYYAVFWRTDVRGASILLGAIAYLVTTTWPKFGTGANSGTWWLAIIFSAFIVNMNLVPDPIKYSVGSAFLAVAVSNVESAPDFTIKIMEIPILASVGVSSFSIYLWQQPFSQYFVLPKSIDMLLVIPALVVAMLSYYCVETPARTMLNRLIMRINSSTHPTHNKR